MRKLRFVRAVLLPLFIVAQVSAFECHAAAQAPITPVPTRLSQNPYGEPIRLMPVQPEAPEHDYVASLRRGRKVRLTGGVFLALGFSGFIAGAIGSFAAYDGDSCDDTSPSSYDEWDLCLDFGPELGVLASAMFAAPFVASGTLMIGLGGRRKRLAEEALGIQVGLGSLRATLAF